MTAIYVHRRQSNSDWNHWRRNDGDGETFEGLHWLNHQGQDQRGSRRALGSQRDDQQLLRPMLLPPLIGAIVLGTNIGTENCNSIVIYGLEWRNSSLIEPSYGSIRALSR